MTNRIAAAACAALVGGILLSSAPASAAPMAPNDFIAADSPITGLSNTTAGGGNVLATERNTATPAGDFPGNENPGRIRDDNTGTKYLNFSDPDGAGTLRPGVNTGFVVTLAAPALATAFQFGAANDSAARDPLTITIEGSTADAATSQAAGFNGFTLLYTGTSGLATDPGRQQYGDVVGFTNTTAYQSYRVLVTSVRGTENSTQYSEFQLLPAVPEPGSAALLLVGGAIGMLTRRRRNLA